MSTGSVNTADLLKAWIEKEYPSWEWVSTSIVNFELMIKFDAGEGIRWYFTMDPEKTQIRLRRRYEESKGKFYSLRFPMIDLHRPDSLEKLKNVLEGRTSRSPTRA